jgi:hypothetical protein
MTQTEMTPKTMTPNDAINVLEMATANVQGTRQEHEMIVMAINALRKTHPHNPSNEVNGVKEKIELETKDN